ncbi:poly(A) polymerase [Aliiruegeria haliotis]|uniref:Poly(A) polymerase n=1 Tax=Aliiruegeria haliotis TaxID=1280846 RepID=A0A2T0RHQ9_9RHOB|nr:CCA tRNA nucleotidyltransferase [Aliiruegeria haliotis]PRY20662.1 poly(A) polymerase [Aliiruegeria haliotis]
MFHLRAPWLAVPAVQRVCTLLEEGGFQALFVGGCVRNSLLGEPVSDHDLSTDARPEQVAEIMEAAGLKVVPTGIDHGTLTVVADGEPFEITTFRKDVETDGRRAVVEFARDVAADARRRDFTMNAVYCDRRGTVIDPLDGLPDIRARRVRFVGDADERVREDYLRILRFFRFSAWYGDPDLGFDADALDACGRNSTGLAQISAERIGAEIRKLLAAPDPSRSVSVMATTGVLNAILTGSDVTALPIVVHHEEHLGLEPDAMLRLAALGAQDVSTRLRLSRRDSRRLQDIGSAARSEMGPGETGYRLGRDDGRASLILRDALMGVTVSPADLQAVEAGSEARFPVSARDLMPEVTGAEIGRTLKTLENRWIASGFQLSRAQLLS